MQKILTISIAAYNVENSIRKTLDSLIDESFIDNLEIFVVDDGGEDRSLRIAEEYAKKYPHSIFPIHKDNGGYGSTINTSIALATGKYFKQLDGDDWFQTENLKDLVGLMKQYDVDCFLSTHIRLYKNSRQEEVTGPYKNVQEGEQSLEGTKISSKLEMYDVAFSTDLLKKVPPVTEHCFYTDLEFTSYAVPYLSSIYMFHHPVYVYQVGQSGQSMSIEGIRAHYKDATTAFWDVCEIYKNQPVSRKKQKSILLDATAYLFQMVSAFYCVLPYSSSVANEMIQFADCVRKLYPEITEQAKELSLRVKILEFTQYKVFPLIALLTKIIW